MMSSEVFFFRNFRGHQVKVVVGGHWLLFLCNAYYRLPKVTMTGFHALLVSNIKLSFVHL